MEVEINSIIKNEIINCPGSIGSMIGKIVTENEKREGKIKTIHKKTTSAMNMF